MKEDKRQLRLLTRGDAGELYKFKKKIKLKVSDQFSASNRDKFFENLITVEELATIFRVNPQTIRNWVARRKIPYIQIGRRNLFQKGSIQKWLNQQEVPLWE